MTRETFKDAFARLNGRQWSFVNDVRLVGELTRVICTLANGAILKGWAKIVSHKLRLTSEGIHAMCVSGPVFSGENRAVPLDLCPIFVRVDRS